MRNGEGPIPQDLLRVFVIRQLAEKQKIQKVYRSRREERDMVKDLRLRENQRLRKYGSETSKLLTYEALIKNIKNSRIFK